MDYPMQQLSPVSNSQTSVFCSSWSPVPGLFCPCEGSSKTLWMFVVSVPELAFSRHGAGLAHCCAKTTWSLSQAASEGESERSKKTPKTTNNPVKIQIGFAPSPAWAETPHTHPIGESSVALQIWPLIFCCRSIPVSSGH